MKTKRILAQFWGGGFREEGLWRHRMAQLKAHFLCIGPPCEPLAFFKEGKDLKVEEPWEINFQALEWEAWKTFLASFLFGSSTDYLVPEESRFQRRIAKQCQSNVLRRKMTKTP